MESERILSSLSVFCEIAPIAAGHHEHLDGTGYPRGLSCEAIGFDTRIISAADMLAALVSERPHRPAFALPDAPAVMHGEIGTKIDPECFGALNDVIDELEPRLSA